MALLTGEQIFQEIKSLPPHEKDNLELLLDKKEQEELTKRMALEKKFDIDEHELFG
ncbi:MAG: hypothetical protein KAT05_16035 [Spirochaetes bacterium]|nr:hypothetical protein [Spirochaetota bacterium]